MPGKSDNLFRVTISTTDNIQQVKEKVAANCSTPAHRQRLIFAGRVLKDHQIVSECKIDNDVTVHMVPIPETRSGSTPQTPAAQQPATPPPAAATPPPAAATPPPQQQGFFEGLGGFGGLGNLGNLGSLLGNFGAQGGAGNSNFIQQMQQQVQQQLLNNPQMLQQIMQSPLMQQMQQQLLNDPETMRELFTSNPQIRDLMERNPEVRQVLQDPAMLRQAVQMAQNPELMREMMRHTDRALTNIENMPGGFNYLRQQYENVIEPLQQATQAPAPQFDQNAAPAAPPSPNPNADPLPNPWANTNAGANPGAGFGGLFPGLGGFNLFGAQPQAQAQPTAAPGVVPGATPGTVPGTAPAQNPFGAGMFGLDPNQFNQALQFANQLFANANANPAAGTAGAAPGAPGAAANPGNMFSMMANMFGQPGAGVAPAGTPQTFQSPEARFAVQLQQLNDMGFNDNAANIRCLTATGGNLNLAIERLLSGE